MTKDEAWGTFQIKLNDYGLAEWSHERYTARRKQATKDAAAAYGVACVAEATATGPERDLAESLAQARLIAEECLADIDTTFRLNVDMRDPTAQVCLQAQKNGIRFVLKRLIEHGTRAEALALLKGAKDAG
jgi:hypothetical protein